MLSIAGRAGCGSGHGGRKAARHSGPQPRLVKAAHEFEAQMMQELLKPMTSGMALMARMRLGLRLGGALGEFASEALGRG
jgi:uncharacterized protein (DUF2342 family)